MLTSDTAGGSDFKVGEPPPPPPPGGDGGSGEADGDRKERFSGALRPGPDEVEVAVVVRVPQLEAKVNYRPGNESVLFELLDPEHRTIATASGAHRELEAEGLAPGTYYFRLSGNFSTGVDYTIKSEQETDD